ncbi:endonuclease/exonuclease/phosphatase family protein [Arthrobacter sp.]|uniref:endonuclease/exonuclease/phosphatase family protein n=1 Tax=Arthrobacter sp. TaxID=1667 RepID=UPI003A953A66
MSLTTEYPVARGIHTPATGAMIGPVDGTGLHVMSYNIRLERAETLPGDPDHWPDRRPLLRELLSLEQPTLLGVQEALGSQLDGVAEGLGPGYDMVGYSRDDDSGGERCAIFHDARRLELLAWDQSWLSDTPTTIGSATWGNDVPRILVWAQFRDATTGKVFVHLNTHFDHESEPARIKSAEAIVALADSFAGLPVIVTGDFNAEAGDSGAHAVLTRPGAFADCWDTTRRYASRAWGTFPGYEEPLEGGARIDWILTTPGTTVHRAGTNVWTRSGRYPSDHAPVQAVISW